MASRAAAMGLTRVRHETLELGGGIRLLLSIAAPLSNSQPKLVLYVLDPEPELFALAAAHLYGRCGYDDDEAPDASVLRGCVIVGVGHDPSLFRAGPQGWKVQSLRELRRRHFLRGEGGFLHAVQHALPRAEAMFGLVGITRERRALLGCSLSSLLALRTVLRPASAMPPDANSRGGGDVFGCIIE